MKYTLLNNNTTIYTDIRRVFANRGVQPEDIEHYLNVSQEDENDPTLLDNMKQGATLFLIAARHQSNVALVVDCDCDGFTAAALLYNYWWRLLPSWVENHWQIFIHENKEHGLSDLIETVLNAGVKLCIVPDAGGGDGEYAQRLKEAGISTLFLDHHDAEPDSYYPGVVINNQHGNYPNRTLSGVGVVYKFCQYFDSLLGNGSGDKSVEYFMDLVSVGCTADLMPLTDYETLYYIRNGIINIHNPFLQAVKNLQEYSISKHGGLDPYCIGFYFAPLINATIRVGTDAEKRLLFLSMLERHGYDEVPSTKRGHKGEFETRAEQAARTCNNVRTRQNKTRDTQLQRIEELICEQHLEQDAMIVVQIPPEEHMDRNILGLIANILMDKYQRPILLLNHDKDTWEWAGSVRNYPYFPITDLRTFLENKPGVNYASGHASAFGVAIQDDRIQDFKDSVINLPDINLEPLYRVDYIFDADDFDAQIVLDIGECKELWGQGFSEPYVAIKDVPCSIETVQLLSKDKNPTLKITLPNGVALMKFRSSEEEYNSLAQADKITYIDVVGKCSTNYWAGTVTPQVIIDDMQINISRWDF